MIGKITTGTQQKEINTSSPLVGNSAHEGTSIDAAGKVILGQTVGAASNPALLDRNAEIPVNPSTVTVTFRDLANALQTILGVGIVTIIDPTTNLPAIALKTSVGANNASVVNNSGNVEMRNSTGVARLATQLSTGNTVITGTIKTGSACLVNSSPVPWALGNVVNVVGLTFDTQDYVETCINGVRVQLAIANNPA